VPLKKGGANYSACCPFHSEKTPSFTVSPAKQFYHCFGCGVHGNAISFLMEYQGLGYVEAVKDLAESVGMKMPEFEPRNKKSESGPDLYAIMEQACDYYREQLRTSQRAVEYLKGRGLTGKIAAHFGIGYAPDGWQNLERVFPDYASGALKEAGLVIDGDGGRRYDRFRDRIMFPILNQRGSVIAFGGRVLGEGEPKYLNSPETPLFEKGRELYGLVQARPAIRAAGRVIVVEGYMDVTALAQLMEQPLPSRPAIQQHIKPALADLKRLRERLANWNDDRGFAQEKMRWLLAHPWLDREPSWDAAEQAFLAMQALNATAPTIMTPRRSVFRNGST